MRRSVASDSSIRFHLASVLRLSDTVVSRAVDAYDRLFALNPDDQAEIYFDMGIEFARAGKGDDALKALRMAVELKPTMGVAWYELGLVHIRRKAMEPAVESLLKARDHGEFGVGLSRYLADALMGVGREKDALAELETVCRLDPEQPEHWYRLGVLNDRLGQPHEAVEAFEQAITLDPAEPSYYQRLGFTLEAMGQRKDAIRCFKKALELEEGGA